jgi:hypothetical protein
MYPQCRHVRPSGHTCDSPAVSGSQWCYFHNRLHQRQAARHTHRRPDGRFAALPAPQDNTATIDYGTYPVDATAMHCHPERSEGPAVHSPSLDLPPVEDIESIQLALIDVLQALAANQLDPKRAGLLLYGLQVASANARKMHLPVSGGVRTVTYTTEGAPLAPQDYGYDIEDYEEEDEEEYEESD